MQRPVFAAIDLGPHSTAVLRRARAGQLEAHEEGRDVRPVIVCHVMPDLSLINPLLPHAGDQATEFTELEHAVRDRSADLIRSSELEQATFTLERGTPYVRVVEAAEKVKAHRIIVGAHSWHEGSSGTAGRIIRHASVPVLVERGMRAEGPILVATDLSENSLVAVRAAHKEAAVNHRPLHVLHVVDTHPVLSMLAATAAALAANPPPPIGVAPLAQASRSLLEASVAMHAPGAICHVREGRAAEVLLQAATELDASLIVIATHGRTGFERALMGSVAERVVDNAACSVLVVRRT